MLEFFSYGEMVVEKLKERLKVFGGELKNFVLYFTNNFEICNGFFGIFYFCFKIFY